MNEPNRDDHTGLTTADVAAAGQPRPADARDAEADRLRFARRDDARLAGAEMPAALFPEDELKRLHSQWSDIQSGFVDEPRRAVEQADSMVAATIKRLAESFADAKSNLEGQWARGGDVSTEDLRLALRRYRSFFDRLLAV